MKTNKKTRHPESSLQFFNNSLINLIQQTLKVLILTLRQPWSFCDQLQGKWSIQIQNLVK